MSYRQFVEDELVIASHNPGKLGEIAALFVDRPFRVTSAQDYDLPEPEETEVTFSGNALLKAQATSFATDKPALADDSGLVIPALNGAPGIYSARWAGPNKDFIMAMDKVNTSLAAVKAKDRTAWFICVLALVWPDGEEAVFEGRIDGTLIWPPRGDQGFGYDPMFVAEGHDLMRPSNAFFDGHDLMMPSDAFW